MNKSWVGYLGSALIFIAGLLMLLSRKYISAALFIAVAIAGVALKMRMNKKQ